jgi:hypothetical protein
MNIYTQNDYLIIKSESPTDNFALMSINTDLPNFKKSKCLFGFNTSFQIHKSDLLTFMNILREYKELKGWQPIELDEFKMFIWLQS